jgi:hypothetical protein
MRQLKNDDSHLLYAVLSFRLIPSLGVVILVALTTARSFSSESEMIGLDAMRRERPGITGAGIVVAQPEASEAANAWQVDPAVNPSIIFRWLSAAGTATNFPNSIGVGSSHAFGVANNFYGSSPGMAPGVPRVDSYEAGYFINHLVISNKPIAGQVVNQSFISNSQLDGAYDAYAATYNVLFVSGMNNLPDTPRAPGTSCNGIGVGIISDTAQSSIGPTTDGRAKPDLVAPHSCCASFTTPRVAGAAALLLQAATSNDGGAGTSAIATNSSVIKALLLNGAVKPTNWTNGVTRPLDARYGAGVLNVYNSDLQLRGGRRAAIATNSVGLGAPHPPLSNTNNVASLRGWDFSRIQSEMLNDRAAHYFFSLPTNVAAYSATATLVWKKGTGALTNLDLFLYETRSNTLMASSTSAVDNVEHLFIPRLAAGRYDLQVLKHGAALPGSESYALAFDFSPAAMTIARSGSNVVVSWPASPAGFLLKETSPNLLASNSWQPANGQSLLSNALNTVTLPASSAAQFLRLSRP